MDQLINYTFTPDLATKLLVPFSIDEGNLTQPSNIYTFFTPFQMRLFTQSAKVTKNLKGN